MKDVKEKGGEQSINCIPKGENANPPITNRGVKGGRGMSTPISFEKGAKK